MDHNDFVPDTFGFEPKDNHDRSLFSIRRCQSETSEMHPMHPSSSRTEYRLSRFNSSQKSPDSRPNGDTFRHFASRDMFRSLWRDGIRRQSSLESGELEDMLENRRVFEQSRIENQEMSNPPSEDEDSLNKVRYNDFGSMENVGDNIPGVRDADGNETITVQCRALWHLRTTFEEENPSEDEENFMMDISPSNDAECKKDIDAIIRPVVSIYGAGDTLLSPSNPSVPQVDGSESQNVYKFLSPEERRSSYKAILALRKKTMETKRISLSTEESFDSCDTDWSTATEMSRFENLSASMDSATDFSEHPTDSHSSPLQQMHNDSGYKSLETRSLFGKDDDDSENVQDAKNSYPDMLEDSSVRPKPRKYHGFLEKRSNRMSAKKRRDALRDCQHFSLDTGLAIETDTSDDNRKPTSRFCRHSKGVSGGSLKIPQKFTSRDYAIDEQSDRLFKEFSLAEKTENRKGKLHPYRKSSRNKETPDSSPRSHRRKLSPHDSIEEEDCSMWEDCKEPEEKETLLYATDTNEKC